MVTADEVRPISDTATTVQVFVNGDPTARQGRSPAGFLDLQDARAEVHGVVLVHGPFVLQRKDQIQVLPAHRQKGMSGLAGRYREAGIELFDVAIP